MTLIPPAEVAAWAAYARSCRPAWEAARYGDRDPAVLELAAVFADWIGGSWSAA